MLLFAHTQVHVVGTEFSNTLSLSALCDVNMKILTLDYIWMICYFFSSLFFLKSNKFTMKFARLLYQSQFISMYWIDTDAHLYIPSFCVKSKKKQIYTEIENR